MAIIGTLMALLLPNITSALNRSKVKQTKIAISQIVQALNNFQTRLRKISQQFGVCQQA